MMMSFRINDDGNTYTTKSNYRLGFYFGYIMNDHQKKNHYSVQTYTVHKINKNDMIITYKQEKNFLIIIDHNNNNRGQPKQQQQQQQQ